MRNVVEFLRCTGTRGAGVLVVPAILDYWRRGLTTRPWST